MILLLILACVFSCVQRRRWSGTFTSPVNACSPSPALTGLFGAVGSTLWLQHCHRISESWYLKKKNRLCLPLYTGSRDGIMEVWRNGTVKHHLMLPEQQRGSTAAFSSALLLPEVPTLPTPQTCFLLPFCVTVVFDCKCFPLFFCLRQREELWSTCVDSAEVCIWHIKDASKPFHRVVLPDCAACHCLIKVKNQVRKHTKHTSGLQTIQ